MRADFCPTFSRRSLSYLAMILARYITCKTLMVQRSWIWDSLNRSKEPISLIPALRTRIATSIVLSLEPIWSWYLHCEHFGKISFDAQSFDVFSGLFGMFSNFLELLIDFIFISRNNADIKPLLSQVSAKSETDSIWSTSNNSPGISFGIILRCLPIGWSQDRSNKLSPHERWESSEHGIHPQWSKSHGRRLPTIDIVLRN